MKVLLINGSPHEKGCTYTALSLIAEELNRAHIETEIFNVGTRPVGGCIGCGGCAAGNGCVFCRALWHIVRQHHNSSRPCPPNDDRGIGK